MGTCSWRYGKLALVNPVGSHPQPHPHLDPHLAQWRWGGQRRAVRRRRRRSSSISSLDYLTLLSKMLLLKLEGSREELGLFLTWCAAKAWLT